MKKLCITTFKVTALSVMVISPFGALIACYSQNQWNPIKEIQHMNQGMLKTFLSGRTSVEQSSTIYDLLKKTTGRFLEPHPA